MMRKKKRKIVSKRGGVSKGKDKETRNERRTGRKEAEEKSNPTR
jgi:hypothetical protein